MCLCMCVCAHVYLCMYMGVCLGCPSLEAAGVEGKRKGEREAEDRDELRRL